MRKVIVSGFVSLDGVMEDPRSGIDQTALKLVDAKTFRSGVVLAYQPAGKEVEG